MMRCLSFCQLSNLPASEMALISSCALTVYQIEFHSLPRVWVQATQALGAGSLSCAFVNQGKVSHDIISSCCSLYLLFAHSSPVCAGCVLEVVDVVFTGSAKRSQ